MQKLPHQQKAYLYALLAVLFWSTISSAFKITLRYLHFENLLFWSAVFFCSSGKKELPDYFL